MENKHRSTLKLLTLALLPLFFIAPLASCGGGGGSSAPTVTPTPPTLPEETCPTCHSINSLPAADQAAVQPAKTAPKEGDHAGSNFILLTDSYGGMDAPSATLTLANKADPTQTVLAPDAGGALDFSQLPNGLLEYAVKDASFTISGITDPVPAGATFKAYQMPYSITATTSFDKITDHFYPTESYNGGMLVRGLATDPAKLNAATMGATASYKGVAFNRWVNNGVLSYTVQFGTDFANSTGSGSISGLKGKDGNPAYDWGTLTLGSIKGDTGLWIGFLGGSDASSFESEWSDGTLTGSGISDGMYFLGLFGPNAQEISGGGYVRIDGELYRFNAAGKKQ